MFSLDLHMLGDRVFVLLLIVIGGGLSLYRLERSTLR